MNPTKRDPQNPQPMTPQVIGHQTALAVQELVATGKLDECHGLATFAADVATIYGNNASKFVEAFAALVPIVPGEDLLGAKATNDAVTLGVGASGFSTQFKDGYGTLKGANDNDQSHHFAFFFQAGFANVTAGTAGVYALETLQGTLDNQGDINLGLAAISMGGLVKAGAMKPADVADRIRKLCDH